MKTKTAISLGKSSRVLAGKRAKNNGKLFESMIDYSCQIYEQVKMAVIEKTPENMRVIKPLGNGQYVACFSSSKSQVDYKGYTVDGKAILFEAKNTDSGRLEHSRVAKHQLEQLVKASKCGVDAFVLVSYKLQDFFKIPIQDFVAHMQYSGRKSIGLKDLDKYRISHEGMWIKFIQQMSNNNGIHD